MVDLGFAAIPDDASEEAQPFITSTMRLLEVVVVDSRWSYVPVAEDMGRLKRPSLPVGDMSVVDERVDSDSARPRQCSSHQQDWRGVRMEFDSPKPLLVSPIHPSGKVIEKRYR